MKNAVISGLIKTIIPPVLGAAGALAATMAPVYYNAMCSGHVPGLL